MLVIANVDSEPPPEMYVTNILLVEDDALIASTIELALQEEGYRVQHALNGQAASELLRIRDEGFENNFFSVIGSSRNGANHEFNLIILDVMLPYLNGLDICRILRRQGDTTPILMLSARSSEIDRVLGLEVGADDYLSKPFGMKELIARCRALLRRPLLMGATPEELVLTYGDIVLDTQEHRVIVRNVEVSLTPKEFLLLEMLMRSPKQVFSREQLLAKIWGAEYATESKTIDVHIRWLREKIEQDPSQPEYLMTVRGFGYRLG
jgi:two-component system, OmpR family, phosphate regulon response regulator PhoB